MGTRRFVSGNVTHGSGRSSFLYIYSVNICAPLGCIECRPHPERAVSWKEPMCVNRGSVVISKRRCCGGALAETPNGEVAGRESHFRQWLMGLVM